MSTDKLYRSAETIMTQCLAVQPSEEVLVIADKANQVFGEILVEAAQNVGADPALVYLPENSARGTEPPASIAAALKAADVFIAPCLPSLSHTQARKEATAAGVRGVTMPGVTQEMLVRMMDADLARIDRCSHAVADRLSIGKTARVRCPLGTDITFDIENREAIADVSKCSEFGNLPSGEGFISPKNGTGVIYTRSLAGVGLAQEPIKIEVGSGTLRSASGSEGKKLLELLDAHGERGRNLAELGIGTHDAAILTGNVLEDEKILGTAHIAFGASAGIGGTVAVPVHLDVVVENATVEVDGVELDAKKLFASV